MRALSGRRRRSSGGNAMIEFALGFSLIFPLFTGSFQFGYAFLVYDNIETAVRAGARYAATRTYDSATPTPSSAYLTAVRNMVVYGNPAGGTRRVAPGLDPANVRVTMTFAKNIPSVVSVDIINYSLDAVVATMNVNGKPKVSFPYLGRWEPVT